MVPKLRIATNQLFRTMYKKKEHIDGWRSDVTPADGWPENSEVSNSDCTDDIALNHWSHSPNSLSCGTREGKVLPSPLLLFWHGLKVYVTLTPKREGTRWPAQWIAQLGHAPSMSARERGESRFSADLASWCCISNHLTLKIAQLE